MLKFAMLFLLSMPAFAGTNNLPTATVGIIHLQDINKFQQAFAGDIVPRDSFGNVGNGASALGQTSLEWIRAFIKSGYWSLGDIKAHHSFNGTAPIEEGWMLCDGRQITQANYDTEHGSGHWATYVGTSGLVNLFLPNLTGRYPVGAASTTQTGSSTITAVGNSGNTVNLSHTHSVTVSLGAANANIDFFTTPFNQYVGALSASSGSALSSSQSIQPDSIQVLYYMRVIQ